MVPIYFLFSVIKIQFFNFLILYLTKKFIDSTFEIGFQKAQNSENSKI